MCQDLIEELVEDAFPVTDRETHGKLYKIIEDSISIYQRRMEQNQSCMQEYVAFLCASTQIDALRSEWNGKHMFFRRRKRLRGNVTLFLKKRNDPTALESLGRKQ